MSMKIIDTVFGIIALLLAVNLCCESCNTQKRTIAREQKYYELIVMDSVAASVYSDIWDGPDYACVLKGLREIHAERVKMAQADKTYYRLTITKRHAK